MSQSIRTWSFVAVLLAVAASAGERPQDRIRTLLGDYSAQVQNASAKFKAGASGFGMGTTDAGDAGGLKGRDSADPKLDPPAVAGCCSNNLSAMSEQIKSLELAIVELGEAQRQTGNAEAMALMSKMAGAWKRMDSGLNTLRTTRSADAARGALGLSASSARELGATLDELEACCLKSEPKPNQQPR